MRDWRDKLDAFLQFNERDILGHSGKVSKAVADSLALEAYETFHHRRLTEEARREALEDDTEIEWLAKRIEGKAKYWKTGR